MPRTAYRELKLHTVRAVRYLKKGKQVTIIIILVVSIYAGMAGFFYFARRKELLPIQAFFVLIAVLVIALAALKLIHDKSH